MNLLTPENPDKLHHADIETQKIVSTWTFQKVGFKFRAEALGAWAGVGCGLDAVLRKLGILVNRKQMRTPPPIENHH